MNVMREIICIGDDDGDVNDDNDDDDNDDDDDDDGDADDDNDDDDNDDDDDDDGIQQQEQRDFLLLIALLILCRSLYLLVKHASYRVFHANTPISDQHFSASDDIREIIETVLSSYINLI